MDIVKKLDNKFHKKVLLRNDAKCAALAEKEIGSIKKYSDSIFLTLGTGIGGAVFMNNKMLVPKNPNGFEIGHMVIDSNGPKCTCGRNGCFETLASMRKLKMDISKRLNLTQDFSGKQIQEILENNETYILVEDIVDTYIRNLTIGISNLISIFKPEAISIGGSFAHYEHILLNKLNRELSNSNALFVKDALPQIIVATLKNEAGIIGATIE